MSRSRFPYLFLACVALCGPLAGAATPGEEKEAKRQREIQLQWSEPQRPDEKVTSYHTRLMDDVRYENPKAMVALGVVFFNNGDQQRGAAWFQAAAEKGNALAAYHLATCYKNGAGVKQNDQLFVKYLQQAADADLSEALADLAIVYVQGPILKPDHAKARELLEKAASTGNPSALVNLAQFENRGIGGPADPDKALQRYREAADAGLADANYSLAETLRIAGKYDESVPYYQRAIKGGVVWANISLGLLYCDGLGVPKDRKKAAELFTKAAEAGNGAGLGIMSDWLQTGEWVKADEKKAKQYAEKCEAQLIANPADNASSLLGGMFLDGVLVKRDLPRALRYLRMGAKAGNTTAQVQTGELLLSGLVGPKDLEEAYVWFWLAARNGHQGAEERFKKVVEQMLPDQIVKAAQRAEALMR